MPRKKPFHPAALFLFFQAVDFTQQNGFFFLSFFPSAWKRQRKKSFSERFLKALKVLLFWLQKGPFSLCFLMKSSIRSIDVAKRKPEAALKSFPCPHWWHLAKSALTHYNQGFTISLILCKRFSTKIFRLACKFNCKVILCGK